MKAIYKIADLYVEIEYFYSLTEKFLSQYKVENASKIDASITVLKSDISFELEKAPSCSEQIVENAVILRKLSNIILKDFNGFLFHASALSYKNGAYLFTAKSGTGKSTHANLLISLNPTEIAYINDDKPIIRQINGVYYVYGTPWMGKHFRGANVKYPLRAIVKVTRGGENSVTKLTQMQMFKTMLEQSMSSNDEVMKKNLLSHIQGVLECCKLYELKCNVSKLAGECSFKNILSE